jgi:plastocyanin
LLISMIAGLCSVALGQEITVTGRVELSNKVMARSDFSGAVVWLTPEKSSPMQSAKNSQRRMLLQKSKSFSPHVLVVQLGSSVGFPNQDPFFHNVFSLFEGKRFDLGLYEAGSSRSVVFNREGISYIFCNIHPEMSAVVLTLSTPYYGISDAKGTLVIPNVPAGSYVMSVWHERVLPETLKALTRRIVLSPGLGSFGTLNLIEERSLTTPHKNKYGRDYDDPTPTTPGYSRP